MEQEKNDLRWTVDNNNQKNNNYNKKNNNDIFLHLLKIIFAINKNVCFQGSEFGESWNYRPAPCETCSHRKTSTCYGVLVLLAVDILTICLILILFNKMHNHYEGNQKPPPPPGSTITVFYLSRFFRWKCQKWRGKNFDPGESHLSHHI